MALLRSTLEAVVPPGSAGKSSDIGVSGGGCGGGTAAIFGVRVWRTQGQPFGTTHLVTGWNEDDSVHLHPREWQWDSTRSTDVAAKTDDMGAARLKPLVGIHYFGGWCE